MGFNCALEVGRVSVQELEGNRYKIQFDEKEYARTYLVKLYKDQNLLIDQIELKSNEFDYTGADTEDLYAEVSFTLTSSELLTFDNVSIPGSRACNLKRSLVSTDYHVLGYDVSVNTSDATLERDGQYEVILSYSNGTFLPANKEFLVNITEPRTVDGAYMSYTSVPGETSAISSPILLAQMTHNPSDGTYRFGFSPDSLGRLSITVYDNHANVIFAEWYDGNAWAGPVGKHYIYHSLNINWGSFAILPGGDDVGSAKMFTKLKPPHTGTFEFKPEVDDAMIIRLNGNTYNILLNSATYFTESLNENIYYDMEIDYRNNIGGASLGF